MGAAGLCMAREQLAEPVAARTDVRKRRMGWHMVASTEEAKLRPSGRAKVPVAEKFGRNATGPRPTRVGFFCDGAGYGVIV